MNTNTDSSRRSRSRLADYLFGDVTFTELFLLGAGVRTDTPTRYHRTGTPPRARRGRGGVMRPGLRVSRITAVLVRRPRHASSSGAR